MKNKRGFEIVSEAHQKDCTHGILPVRATQGSAGYDFSTPIEVTIPAQGKKVVWTNIKSYMQQDEVLMIYVRSSIGIKRGLTLSNGTGIIDSDYYSNEGNDGNIGICLSNNTAEDVVLAAEERIAQGVFLTYLAADGDTITETRIGGIGSSNA